MSADTYVMLRDLLRSAAFKNLRLIANKPKMVVLVCEDGHHGYYVGRDGLVAATPDRYHRSIETEKRMNGKGGMLSCRWIVLPLELDAR